MLLRRHGIAARYVSGYLWAAPEDGGEDSLEVQTHAWLEALLPGDGARGEPVWVGADPTNRRLAGETHVKIGHGRHYADVPPIKGVFRGPPARSLDARVTDVRGWTRRPARTRLSRATLRGRLAPGRVFSLPGAGRARPFPSTSRKHQWPVETCGSL